MLGTIVNALAIFTGSLGGYLITRLLKKGIPERINDIIMKGLALCVLLIGISGALEYKQILLVIISIVIGGIIGEVIDIDKQIQRLGDKLEKGLKGKAGKVSQGFVTASLVYCIGAMAVMGSLESGLNGNHEILFAKSIIDGMTAVVFTTTLGIGVAFSAITVFLYQGTITIGAIYLKDLLTVAVVSDMSAIGGLLIIGIALNMMGLTKIKVANLLPAVFIPIVYQIILNVF
ncbi:MAG: hypothetical protein K0R09_1370 [Clostridiales bacterium]|nr:hypothetical protein [Clostridiales bacterium]